MTDFYMDHCRPPPSEVVRKPCSHPQGSYGIVYEADDLETGEKVAVKRIQRVFSSFPQAIRVLRELKFLRLLREHENIITVKTILVPGDRDRFDDVFVVQELMPSDLQKIVRQPNLRADHIKYLMFQLLRGLYFLHTARVFHRDLKPGNLLVNDKCHLRICDFGMARASFASEENEMIYWTDYVATRWYRAPELILSHVASYSTAIDMWSAGCIFGELLLREPLFPGINWQHQLQLIVEVTGTPTSEEISGMNSKFAQDIVRDLPRRPQRPLAELYPHINPNALRVVDSLLQFDPSRRLSAGEAIQDPFFEDLWYLGCPTAPEIDRSEFSFERMQFSQEDMRREFLREIRHYHPDVVDSFDSMGGDAFRDFTLSLSRGAVTKPTTLPQEAYDKMEEEERLQQLLLRQRRMSKALTLTESDINNLIPD